MTQQPATHHLPSILESQGLFNNKEANIPQARHATTLNIDHHYYLMVHVFFCRQQVAKYRWYLIMFGSLFHPIAHNCVAHCHTLPQNQTCLLAPIGKKQSHPLYIS
jgi:hypothetical protein